MAFLSSSHLSSFCFRAVFLLCYKNKKEIQSVCTSSVLSLLNGSNASCRLFTMSYVCIICACIFLVEGIVCATQISVFFVLRNQVCFALGLIQLTLHVMATIVLLCSESFSLETSEGDSTLLEVELKNGLVMRALSVYLN